MAQVVVPEDLFDLMERIGAAAKAGADVVDPDVVVTVAPTLPPIGEQVSSTDGQECDSIMVWCNGLLPIADPGECSILWDAQIAVRVELCVGVSETQEQTGLVDADEQESRAETFSSLVWAALAGLTSAWKAGTIPYPDLAGKGGCKKLTWGQVLPAVEEGGILAQTILLNVEISPTYVESS